MYLVTFHHWLTFTNSSLQLLKWNVRSFWDQTSHLRSNCRVTIFKMLDWFGIWGLNWLHMSLRCGSVHIILSSHTSLAALTRWLSRVLNMWIQTLPSSPGAIASTKPTNQRPELTAAILMKHPAVKLQICSSSHLYILQNMIYSAPNNVQLMISCSESVSVTQESSRPPTPLRLACES